MPERTSFRAWQWAVFGCLALHNLEEGIFAGANRARIQDLLARAGGTGVPWPTVAEFRLALVWATLVPLALTAYAATGRPARAKDYASAVVAATVLVNVFAPHLALTVALRSYTPGVVTAVLLNLPACAYFLRRSLREGRITPRGLALSGGAALVVLGAGLPLLHAAIHRLDSKDPLEEPQHHGD